MQMMADLRLFWCKTQGHTKLIQQLFGGTLRMTSNNTKVIHILNKKQNTGIIQTAYIHTLDVVSMTNV